MTSVSSRGTVKAYWCDRCDRCEGVKGSTINESYESTNQTCTCTYGRTHMYIYVHFTHTMS